MKKTIQNYAKKDNLLYFSEKLDQQTDKILIENFIFVHVNGQNLQVKRNAKKFPLICDQIEYFKILYRVSEQKIKIKEFNPLKQFKKV